MRRSMQRKIAAASSAILSARPDYRDTFSRCNPILTGGSSLSVPWRLNLSTLDSSESGSHYGGPGSQASRDASRHKWHCVGKCKIPNAVAKIGPAVVNISVPQGLPGLLAGKSMGSGTIIDADGTILTCAHVTEHLGETTSDSKVEVRLHDGRVFEGSVLNADLNSDVAIVKIKSSLPLPYAKIGTSSQLRPGDWVIAVGYPLSLQNTVTAGSVSGIIRRTYDLGLNERDFLQTDCPINKENSGGPLVNMEGEVVGLNAMKLMGGDGLGFSMPIDSVCKVVKTIKKYGRVVRPWSGLHMFDMSIAGYDKEATYVKSCAMVVLVEPGSPAERAGFLTGDVVIEIDQKPVRCVKEAEEILDDKVGVPVKVVVKRGDSVGGHMVVVPEEGK